MTDIHVLHKLTLADPGQHLFAALATAIPGLSRSQARQAVMAGLVTVENRTVREPKHELPARARVEVDLRHGVRKPFVAARHVQKAPDERPFGFLHEDSSMIVVDKAAGVLSAPGAKGERGAVPELVRRALKKRGRDAKFLGVVHRLDKDTSGCLALALTREAQRMLSEQFASHTARRVYRCWVRGGPKQDQDTISGKMLHGKFGRRVLARGEDAEEEEGKEAVTRFTVLRRLTSPGGTRASELEVELETGRTHQIRVSLAAIGCPVLGDRVYGFRGDDRSLAPGQKPLPEPRRLLLHAHRLELDHPSTGERLTITAPLPAPFDDYAHLLK